MSDCSTEAFKPHARMDKSKRQLRAEAVERLRKSEEGSPVDMLFDALGVDRGTASYNMYGHEANERLIDLLTDDELPEGDVAAILRKAASYDGDYSGPGEALRRLTDSTTVYYALETLADMIERDYVRREAYDDLQYEFVWTNAFLHRMGKQCGTKDVPSLVAYVEQLEAKCNAQSSAEIEDMERSRAVSGDSWQDADVDSTEGAKAAQDSREKLEADVEGICWGKNDNRYLTQKRYLSSAGIEVDESNVMANHEGHVLMTVIMHLLDRQESITERHWMEICGANANANIELKRQNEELRLKVRRQGKQLAEVQDAIHKRNDGVLKNSWKKQLAELQAERDMYRDKLGRAIDAAHEIVRMVDE